MVQAKCAAEYMMKQHGMIGGMIREEEKRRESSDSEPANGVSRG
jgi:hypothetical protein